MASGRWAVLGVLVMALVALQMTEVASASELKPRPRPGGNSKKPSTVVPDDHHKSLLPPGLQQKKPVLPPGLKKKKPVLPPAPKPSTLIPLKPKKPELPPKQQKKPTKPAVQLPPKKKKQLTKPAELPPKKKVPVELPPKKKLPVALAKQKKPTLAPAPAGSNGLSGAEAADELNALPGLPNLPDLPFNPLAPFQSGPWLNDAHATFYGDDTGAETMGGACGYGDLFAQGYGLQTTALSEVMFNNGYGCGECYEMRCAGSRWCNAGASSITVTATNLCPADWSKPSDAGGWCNPPRKHFDLSKPAFLAIAQEVAGIVPVAYRRVPCIKVGGVQFSIFGNQWWHLVHITNVGGAGDIDTVAIKGSNTQWLDMTRNWGATYQIFQSLVGQALSFRITSKTGQVLTSWNVAPPTWQFGVTYVGSQFP